MTKHTPGLKSETMTNRRVIIIVLDGAGVGALPDAAAYGDAGANTLLNIFRKHGPLELPNLLQLGLGRILELPSELVEPGNACYGRLAPRSPGKDTTSGHWELAGVTLDKPFPVYPQGFPPEVIKPFEQVVGLKVLGNRPASGTAIIEELGERHLETGAPIVYTSADSVFQIAAHEAVVPLDKLYHWCLQARRILQGEHAVGRVIARPFNGKPGGFYRTPGRKDYSLPPPGNTILDRVEQAGFTTAVIGKVADIFNNRGISKHLPGGNNEAVAKDLLQLTSIAQRGLIWATFGDFDTLYGHRNDSNGFALALENFDRYLPILIKQLQPGDLLFITADHGCDPTWPGTDHTREYVPLLITSPNLQGAYNLGTHNFADLAASAAWWLNLDPPENGRQFLSPYFKV